MEDFSGKIIENITCIGCARERGTIDSQSIHTTEFFCLEQDFEVPIPGFLVLSTRKHIQSIDEFDFDMQQEFMELLIKARKFLREECSIDTVYLFQNEDTSHHFHMWIFPRYDWMEEKFGKKIQSVRGIMEYAQNNLKTVQDLEGVEEVLLKARKYFLQRI